MATGFSIVTACGTIKMRFRPDAAPETVKYMQEMIGASVYNNRTFYRSDFVIQCGLHPDKAPKGLSVNETAFHAKISNTRGTAAVAHWDVPDCGNTEFFINLQPNTHLDTAYGGYCVFAEVADEPSYAVVDAIAGAVSQKGSVALQEMRLESGSIFAAAGE